MRGDEGPAKAENPWANLGFNLVIPSLLLIKGEDWFGDFLPAGGPGSSTLVFLLALAFPLGYGAYDLVRRRKANFLSLLGLVGVLLTGGIGLLRLPPEWVAVKEAGIPALLGVATAVSAWTRYPLVRVFLYRKEIFATEKIDHLLRERGEEGSLDRLLRRTTGLLAGSFFLSAVLNFLLAVTIVQSPAGTEAFNRELGQMMAWSYPVILLPTLLVTVVALWLALRGLRRLTGLPLEELLVEGKKG